MLGLNLTTVAVKGFWVRVASAFCSLAWRVLIYPVRSITLPGSETMLSSVFYRPGESCSHCGSSLRLQLFFHVTFGSASQGVPGRHERGFGWLFYLGFGAGEEIALNGFPAFSGTWRIFWYQIPNSILLENLSCPIQEQMEIRKLDVTCFLLLGRSQLRFEFPSHSQAFACFLSSFWFFPLSFTSGWVNREEHTTNLVNQEPTSMASHFSIITHMHVSLGMLLKSPA